MNNNGNCDVCSGNPRNNMDMRRQRPTMYERYPQNHMMPRMQSSCEGCRRTNDELKGMPLAMGYVPWQNYSCTYEPAEAMHAGTIFPELDKPFLGRKGYR